MRSPTSQASHASVATPNCPASLLTRAAGQSVHAPFALTSSYLPAAQGWHVEAVWAPMESEAVPAAQDWHAQQRVKDFFTCFRPVGKLWMLMSVGQCQRSRVGGNIGHTPFACA